MGWFEETAYANKTDEDRGREVIRSNADKIENDVIREEIQEMWTAFAGLEDKMDSLRRALNADRGEINALQNAVNADEHNFKEFRSRQRTIKVLIQQLVNELEDAESFEDVKGLPTP